MASEKCPAGRVIADEADRPTHFPGRIVVSWLSAKCQGTVHYQMRMNSSSRALRARLAIERNDRIRNRFVRNTSSLIARGLLSTSS